jgi:hypothetical protein
MILITENHIKQVRTPNGGFNQATLEALGCWPLSTGWKLRLIGREVSNQAWKDAVNASKKGPIYRRRGNAGRRR